MSRQYQPKLINRALKLRSEGYSMADVLAKLGKEFNKVPDERTIRRWQKATLEAQATEEQKTVNLEVHKLRRKEHHEKLSNVAYYLLANNLDKVHSGHVTTKSHTANSEPIESRKFEYAVVGSIYDDFYQITEEEMSDQLEKNVQGAIHEYGYSFFYECFMKHLNHDLPEDIRTLGFHTVIKQHPYTLIEVLRDVAERKIFSGTCRICEGW